jgi:uncharacterized protein (TIGR03435 family)
MRLTAKPTVCFCKPARRLLLIAAGCLIVAAPGSEGQAPQKMQLGGPPPEAAPGPAPPYEVSSIKPNKSGDGRMMIRFNPDGVSYSNVPLQWVLRETFGIEDSRILGAPDWVNADRFDIQAKVDPADAPKLDKVPYDVRGKMLLPVLADRFGLKFHHETRELPTYALVVAKGGLKMKEAKPGDTYPNGIKGPDGQARGGAGMMMGRGSIIGQGVGVSSLLNVLSNQRLGRPIFDKTGLTGNYDFDLHWTPDDAPPMAGGAQAGSPGSDAATDPGPSLFTALQEQLGLRLDPQKGPVDVVVIDHIEQPSAN